MCCPYNWGQFTFGRMGWYFYIPFRSQERDNEGNQRQGQGAGERAPDKFLDGVSAHMHRCPENDGVKRKACHNANGGQEVTYKTDGACDAAGVAAGSDADDLVHHGQNDDRQKVRAEHDEQRAADVCKKRVEHTATVTDEG